MPDDFQGFTIAEGAWLPPEIVLILPWMETAAEIKVVLAALYDACQVGRSGMALSLSDLERLTGLSRDSVIAGRRAAKERGIFTTIRLGGQDIYQLNIAASRQSRLAASRQCRPPSRESRPAASRDSRLASRESRPRSRQCRPHVCMNNISDSLSVEQQHTCKQLTDFGVAAHVATSIVLKHDLDYIARHLEFAQLAADTELAENPPGWFIRSLHENWQEPLITNVRGSQTGTVADYLQEQTDESEAMAAIDGRISVDQLSPAALVLYERFRQNLQDQAKHD